MNRRHAIALLSAAGLGAAKTAEYTLRREDGRIHVLSGGRLFTTFHYEAEFDRPYVHPLVTPSGIEMSRGVPPRRGEDTDHDWHRGLWWGHGEVSGADFWRERVDNASGKKTTGRIVVAKTPAASGSTIVAMCDLTNASGVIIGRVEQQFRFSGSAQSHIIDCSITIMARSGMDLLMADSDDGGLAIRLTNEFEEKNGGTMLNSEGQKGTAAMWGKPARWVDYSGVRDGKPCGVAILDHPKNFRYPTEWHARGYGLNSANPFAHGSFNRPKGDRSKPTAGDHTVRKGTDLKFRYRVVLHDGDAAAANIDSMLQEFSKS
jgi:hypothetical protein